MTGLTTSDMTTSSGFGLINASPYGSSNLVWTFQSGYYPQLYNFENGSGSSYSTTSPSSITVAAFAPSTSTQYQAWSALSVLPFFLSSSDATTSVGSQFSVPLISAQAVNSALSWTTSSSLITLPTGSSSIVTVGSTKGTATFQVADANGYTKLFYIYVGGFPYYVRGNYSGSSDSNDGLSWSTAFKTIQHAVDQSGCKTVYVAAGTYSQSSTTGDYAVHTSSTGNWNGWYNAFVIRPGINVYGGFPEYGTANNNRATISDRVVLSSNSTYKTVLQGGTNTRVLAPTYSYAFWNASQFTSATWDGFVLTGANMTTNPGQTFACGGGAFIGYNCTLSNSIVENNAVNSNDGGGVLLYGGTLRNCIIRFNTASSSGRAGGVGIGNGNSKVINCLIYGNSDSYDSSTSKHGAGGILFYDNSSALGSNNSSPCYLINNTIANNTNSSHSTGVFVTSGQWAENLYVYNNAVWSNSFDVSNGTGTNYVQYNGFPSSVSGTGNIVLSSSNATGTNPPYFSAPTNTSSASYRIASSSSVLVNAASRTVSSLVPSTDIRGITRGTSTSMGCYEYVSLRYFVNGSTGVDNKNTNGFSWTLPFKTLQYAIDQCSDPADSAQIWVAAGSYTPTKNQNGSTVSNETSTFVLKPGVSVYGGFTGSQSTEYSSTESIMLEYLNHRNLKFNVSLLTSNSIASKALINCPLTGNTSGALLDGFFITGAASGSYAVLVDSATIRNCKIISNSGGGIKLNTAGSAYNVVVANNGGAGVSLAGNAKVVNATIANNTGYGIFSD